MREIIENFLKSDRESIPLQVHPIQTYRDILKDFGYELGGCEHDGWQVDFWEKFSKGDKSITLSGSLWYGQYKLTKD